jgi:hypothetical protein
MRRSRVVGIVLTVLGFGAGTAQPATAQLAGIGVMVGPTFSSFRGANSSGFETTTGFVAGGFVRLDLGSVVGLRPEFLYVQKGAQTNTTPQRTFTIEYFEVPVLVTYDLALGGILYLEFYTGPEVSILSKCRAETDGGQSGVPCTAAGLPVKSTDFGWIFGGELAIKNFLLGVRYDMGISQIVDDPNRNLKNESIMATLGFLFRFPGE